MKVAWFHPSSADEDDEADDVRRLVHELRATHDVEIIDENGAHEFVWRHARRPYDLCVYDLADTPAHQYVWPYLLHVPGVVALRATTLRESRVGILTREGRDDDYRAELAFGGRPMLRAPLMAARLVVVFDVAVARELEREYPGVRIEIAPAGVQGCRGAKVRSADDVLEAGKPPTPVRFGVVGGSQIWRIERAARRAREGGASIELVTDTPLEQTIRDSDVIIALRWPPEAAPLPSALLAMAAARPCIVLETQVNAAWPALDPQSWRSRDPFGAAEPVVVSLDVRDEEHSLVLAMRRLSTDAVLRASLGAAAQAWWRQHATMAPAVAAWRRILDRAASLQAPPHPSDWPPHLTADGTAAAREILRAFGLTIDLLD